MMSFKRRWLGKLNAVPKPTRAQYRQHLAKLAIDTLQLPDDLPNTDLVKLVSDWLKANNRPPVSRTTILRAASRRSR